MKMKRTKVALIVTIFILCSSLTNAQSVDTTLLKGSRQFVGVQLNPYLTKNRSRCRTFTLRYGIEIYKNLYVGPEMSAFFYNDRSGNTGSEINTGLFARMTFLNSKKIRIIVEPGLNYKYGKYLIYYLEQPGYSTRKIDWYGSAGVNFNLYKKKISMDLMVKYSPDYYLLRATKVVPTYKLNYHFK